MVSKTIVSDTETDPYDTQTDHSNATWQLA